MRFLLNVNVNSRNITSSRFKKVASKTLVARGAVSREEGKICSKASKLSKSNVKTWGQQCSPTCGCTIRFETELDSTNNLRILSAKYHAKSVLMVPQQDKHTGRIGPLLPYLTQSENETSRRPILKECSCPTLHNLASKIVHTLPQLTLSQAQNQLEFSGVRSSLSFRYSVLRENGLLKSQVGTKSDQSFDAKQILESPLEGKCYDLVEEALVACLKGYMLRPRPRKIIKNNGEKEKEIPFKESKVENDSYQNGKMNPLRFVQAAKRRTGQLNYQIQAENKNININTMHGNETQCKLSSSIHMPEIPNMSRNDENSIDSLWNYVTDKVDNSKNYKLNSNTENGWVSYVDEIRMQNELT